MRYILWFWRTKDSWPPSLFAFITLITYQFSLLPFACLACLCASLCSRTLVSPLTLPGVLTYQHTWFCLFAISTVSSQSHQSFLPKFFFNFPSPVSCLSLFTFHSTLPPSWLPSVACFTCLFVVSLCGLCLCGCTGELDWRGAVSCSLLLVRVDR